MIQFLIWVSMGYVYMEIYIHHVTPLYIYIYMKWNTGRILIYISMIGHQHIDMCTIIYIYIFIMCLFSN